MRWGVVALLAGCGRVDFAEHDAASDASDGASGQQCTARRIANFDYGLTGATDLAAAQVSNGYAIGALFSASTLWGVALDASLTPNTDIPLHTTPAPGTDGAYVNGSLYFDGTNLDGALSRNDGTCFLKTFAPDMSTFLTAPMRSGQVGQQSIARAAGTTLFSFWFQANTLQFVELLADGTPNSPDLVLTTQPTTILDASAADGPAAVVVWELADGSCHIAGIASNGSSITVGSFSNACSRPYLDGNGTDVAAVYEDAGQIHSVHVSVTALPIVTVLTDDVIAPGRDPKLVRIAGARWAAWHDSSRLHLAPLATLADTGINNLPSGPPDAYEPAGPYLFAIWGSELWALTCP